MDRLQLLTVFVAVAEEESFAAAARRLSLSAPVVTRAIAALEQHLGVRLLLRTTRHVRTTEAGQRYLQDARRIMTEIETADAAVAGIHAKPSGHLTVTAPQMFGSLYVVPVITEYMRRYEQVNVAAMFYDRVTNLLEEGLDVGIRIGELPDSSLHAIRVGTVRIGTYATPDYLEKHGRPRKPEDLQNHRLITSQAGSGPSRWRYFRGGDEMSLKLKPRLTTTTNDAALAAAANSFGITRVLSYQAASLVAEGLLVPLLQKFGGAPIPINIVHPQGRNVPAKVRAFIDLAVEQLRAEPALREARNLK